MEIKLVSLLIRPQVAICEYKYFIRVMLHSVRDDGKCHQLVSSGINCNNLREEFIKEQRLVPKSGTGKLPWNIRMNHSTANN